MSGSFRFAQVGGLVFLALLTPYAVPALRAAPPHTVETIQTGAAQLAEGRLEDALQSFQTSARHDPQHGQAHFFIGVTLNRLERANEALHHLSRAAALGTAHPDLPFETGWSLLMLRRWEDAIEQLTHYEAAHPGRGQTSEFLGRAYLALGRLD